MDLEVDGRHAMFFDDDAMAAFANSPEALVNWNSLSIDRYDVRHLLAGPLPPRPKRRPPPPSIEADLDYERYLDLPSSSSEDQDQAPDDDLEAGNSAGFHAVAFSYENPNESAVMKDEDTETGFHPQFPVPENLLNNLPPNEKVHQIISRTAMFVSKHGSQSEIVLRVKQGDNPTFGFLMPDHRLHAYFRYLVDHQELLTIDNNGNSSMDKNRSQGLDQTGGALSLLGSVYGSGEDEEGTNENTQELERKVCEDAVGAANNTATETVQAESSSDTAKKDGSISKNPVSSLKEKVPVIKRNHSISNVKAVTASREKTSDDVDSVSNAADKSRTSVPNTTKISLPIVEPPSDLKIAMEKIAEFIVNNGKQFEAVLAEQDRAHGRFPFLVPSNRYHTYYLKVLQNTEESKLSGKVPQKQNSAGRAGERNTARETSDNLSSGSLGSDLPCDTDRKEKFKMTVASKSKKNGQDSEDSQSQKVISVDATAAAAILQAATRGIKKPNLEFLTKTSSGNGQGLGSDGGLLSSTGSLYSSQLQRLVENSNLKADISGSAPVAKAIAEHVAIAAAREADSSEAHMTKEEKLKADRLKRAKMFAAMLKNGVAPVKSETPRGLSVEPPGSGLSGSDAEAGSLVGKEREGSSVPFDVDNSDKSQKSEEKHSVDNSDTSHKSKEKLAIDNDEQRKSKRKYRSRSEKQEEEEEEEENTEDKTDHKQSRKEHRSHRSSHSSRDRHKHKHKRRHSSSKDRHSYKRHKDDSSSDNEDHHSRHHHEKDSSDDDKYRSSRRRHRENSTSDNEHRRSRHRNKHYSSSEDDEQRHRSRNVKHKSSRYHAEKERELEEGEIVVKSDRSKAKEVEKDSREASVARVPSQSPETTEVSDELRAKIRAMLMANL